MKSTKKNRIVSLLLLPALAMFFSPHLVMGTAGGGNLLGFVYAADRTTPVAGAVLKLRNVESGEEKISGPSDQTGIIAMQDVAPGLYVAGITSGEKDFNFEDLIGIRAGTTGKVAFALVEDGYEGPDGKKTDSKADKEDKKKHSGILGFFTSPAGLAMLGAATSGAALALARKRKRKRKRASPFR